MYLAGGRGVDERRIDLEADRLVADVTDERRRPAQDQAGGRRLDAGIEVGQADDLDRQLLEGPLHHRRLHIGAHRHRRRLEEAGVQRRRLERDVALTGPRASVTRNGRVGTRSMASTALLAPSTRTMAGAVTTLATR